MHYLSGMQVTVSSVLQVGNVENPRVKTNAIHSLLDICVDMDSCSGGVPKQAEEKRRVDYTSDSQ